MWGGSPVAVQIVPTRGTGHFGVESSTTTIDLRRSGGVAFQTPGTFFSAGGFSPSLSEDSCAAGSRGILAVPDAESDDVPSFDFDGGTAAAGLTTVTETECETQADAPLVADAPS